MSTIAYGLPSYTPPPPVSATGIIAVSNGGDGAGNTISVIDAATGIVITTIPVGMNPLGIAFSHDSKFIAVANNYDGTVSVIETSGYTVVQTLAVGGIPVDVAFSPDDSILFVSGGGILGNVVVVETSGWTTVTDFVLGASPSALAFSPDGSKLVVLDPGEDQFYVLETTGWTVTATETVGGPERVAWSPDGTFVAVTGSLSGDVTIFDASDFDTTIATISTDSNPIGIAVSPDSSTVVVVCENAGTLTVIQASDWSSETFPIGDSGNEFSGVTYTNDGLNVAVLMALSSDSSGETLVLEAGTWALTETVDVGESPLWIAAAASPSGPPTPPVPPPPPPPGRRIESGRSADGAGVPQPIVHIPHHRRLDNGLRVVMSPVSGITPNGIFPHGRAFHFQCAPINQFGESGSFNWQDYDTLSAGQHSQRIGRQLRTIQLETIFLDWEPSWAVALGHRGHYPAQQARDLLCKIRDAGHPFRLTVTNPRRDRAEVDYAAKLVQVDWVMQAGEVDAYYIAASFTEFVTPDILEFLTGHHPHLPVTLVVAKLPHDRNTLHKLAKFYYGDPSKARHIATYNRIRGIPFSEILTVKNTHKKKITVPRLRKTRPKPPKGAGGGGGGSRPAFEL